ncbi:MAG: hypothetical protein ACE5NN_01340 [Candidatus Bathyarchaeia archaeon]
MQKYEEDLTSDLRAFLMKKGADLVGFGPVDRLEGAPEIMQPQRYLPDAVSMISVGLHINEAVCDLIARSFAERRIPPSYHSFQMFTLGIVNPQLDTLAYLGSKFLEHKGYKAYPFPANIPHRLKPTKEYPGGPGDISHKHVAVACGLGDIGWHNLLLTPKYGPRQKLTTIVTNAPLQPDPLLERKMCDPESCGFKCALACPTSAIPTDIKKKVTIKIGGKIVEYARIEGWRCRWGCSGMLKITGGYKDIPMPNEEPTAEELLTYKAQIDPWQERMKTLAGLLPYCGRCLSICPAQDGGFK